MKVQFAGWAIAPHAAGFITAGCLWRSGPWPRREVLNTAMIDFKQALRRTAALVPAVFLVLCAWAGAAMAGVLQTVRERGHVVCGVSERLPGLSAADAKGQWSGIEVEFCGAVAAAVLGEREMVKFRSVSAGEGPRALADGDIDILMGGTVWTLSREADLGMRSAGVLFHDGQGLMVPRSFGVSSVLELSGASICVQQSTGAEKAVGLFFDERKMRYHLVLGEKWADVVNAYKAGTCTLLTGDLASLAVERSRLAAPAEHVLLSDLVTHEMTGPFVRQGDDPWLTVVHWSLLALIEAERLGLTRATLENFADTPDARVRRFLGRDSALGAALGLTPGWTERIVAEVGNYGEIFARTLGEGSRLKLSRGDNELWTKGGLMAAPQFR
jgi:general L-amino acid transport system substrate-binding protein